MEAKSKVHPPNRAETFAAEMFAAELSEDKYTSGIQELYKSLRAGGAQALGPRRETRYTNRLFTRRRSNLLNTHVGRCVTSPLALKNKKKNAKTVRQPFLALNLSSEVLDNTQGHQGRPEAKGVGVLVDLSEGWGRHCRSRDKYLSLWPQALHPPFPRPRLSPGDTAVASWPRCCLWSGAAYVVKGMRARALDAAVWVHSPVPAACGSSCVVAVRCHVCSLPPSPPALGRGLTQRFIEPQQEAPVLLELTF